MTPAQASFIDQFNTAEALHPVEVLNLDTIVLAYDIQPRTKINQERVEAYQAIYEEHIDASTDEGVADGMPAIVVFGETLSDDPNQKWWLADGFHRVLAATKADRLQIEAIIMPGTKRDAHWYALTQANHDHGLAYSNKDKRRIVETILADAEWSQLPIAEIAAQAHCQHGLVYDIKREIEQAAREARAKDKGWTTGLKPPVVPDALVEALSASDRLTYQILAVCNQANKGLCTEEIANVLGEADIKRLRRAINKMAKQQLLLGQHTESQPTLFGHAWIQALKFTKEDQTPAMSASAWAQHCDQTQRTFFCIDDVLGETPMGKDTALAMVNELRSNHYVELTDRTNCKWTDDGLAYCRQANQALAGTSSIEELTLSDRCEAILKAHPGVTSGDFEDLCWESQIDLPATWYENPHQNDAVIQNAILWEARWYHRSQVSGIAAIENGEIKAITGLGRGNNTAGLLSREGWQHCETWGVDSSASVHLVTPELFQYCTKAAIDSVVTGVVIYSNGIADRGTITESDPVPQTDSVPDAPPAQQPEAKSEPAPQAPSKKYTANLVDRRHKWMCKSLAEQIETTAVPTAAPLETLSRLALLLGIDSGVASWEEARTASPNAFADAVKASVVVYLSSAYANRRQLPELPDICAWWHIDFDSLRINAERTITE